MFDFVYVTVDKYIELNKELDPNMHKSRKELLRSARLRDEGKLKCDCGNDVWVTAGLGMCFSCITGETDASDDYEVLAR